jgi:hypothetical protein
VHGKMSYSDEEKKCMEGIKLVKTLRSIEKNINEKELLILETKKQIVMLNKNHRTFTESLYELHTEETRK